MDPAELTPLAGGWSGQTFLARTGADRSVVRIYPPGRRPDDAPEVDAAVLRLVRGLVPVPEVLEVRRGDTTVDRPGLLVTAHVPGERGDLLLPTLDDDDAGHLGGHLGAVAADLAGMPTLRAGWFADADLRIADFVDLGIPADLPGLVDHHAGSLGFEPGLLGDLRALAADSQDLLDSVSRTSVVHSDLNPKNVLVDPHTLTLTGVLDWEFCHAGHPFTDLGNLLRFDRRPAYADAVLAAWCARRGGDPGQVRDLARAADLWALVDLAARAGSNPVADRAAVLLRAVASAGDLHAWPASWTLSGAPA